MCSLQNKEYAFSNYCCLSGYMWPAYQAHRGHFLFEITPQRNIPHRISAMHSDCSTNIAWSVDSESFGKLATWKVPATFINYDLRAAENMTKRGDSVLFLTGGGGRYLTLTELKGFISVHSFRRFNPQSLTPLILGL